MSAHYVLGISAFYHDAAASIVHNDRIIAAAQEERFTRKKHDPRFPRHAINYCLEEAGIEADQLAAVAYYDDPALTADRIIRSSIAYAPKSERYWVNAAKSFFAVKPHVRDLVESCLGLLPPMYFARHHASHAASAFYPSPYREAAILCIDGVGEWATTTLGAGREAEIDFFAEIRYPHSLGLLYSAFTHFCGFKVNSGEYKLMGLAPYGTARYAAAICDHLIDVKPDGSFRLNLDYFDYHAGDSLTNDRFHELFGGKPRLAESRITRREMDLAASIQVVTEGVVVRLARHLRTTTALPNLCLAGGVALNCVANGKILRERIFDGIWIQPAAGDAGGAIGAALLTSIGVLGASRATPDGVHDSQNGSFLGPAYSQAEVATFVKRSGAIAEHLGTAEDVHTLVAHALADEKVVGLFSGRMEFGPRSLGARSILGDPRSPRTQSVMNLKIKFRESFRPFAPAVLAEKASEYFDLDVPSPYMLLVAPVQERRRTELALDETATDDLLPLVSQVRSDIPAVTHVDFSARVQTVEDAINPTLAGILREFEKLTGYAVVVNTSFNVRGEPIVCTPEDAYRCFMRTHMDLLVMDGFAFHRSQQPPPNDDQDWAKEFELD